MTLLPPLVGCGDLTSRQSSPLENSIVPLGRLQVMTPAMRTGCYVKIPKISLIFGAENINWERLPDEDGPIDFLETQLELVGKLGEEKYALLNVSKMDAYV